MQPWAITIDPIPKHIKGGYRIDPLKFDCSEIVVLGRLLSPVHINAFSKTSVYI